MITTVLCLAGLVVALLVVAGPRWVDQGVCRCGHPKPLHEHLRDGSDCAFRPSCGCEWYQSRGRWSR